MSRRYRKLSPYGYVSVSGETVRRCDTVRAALKVAARVRNSFAAAGLYPTITVTEYLP